MMFRVCFDQLDMSHAIIINPLKLESYREFYNNVNN